MGRPHAGLDLEVEIEPFGRLTKSVRAAAEREAAALAAFLGRDQVSVTWR